MTATLDRIEAILLANAEEQASWRKANAEEQASWRKDMKLAITGLIEAQTSTQKSLAGLTASISQYVDASDARLKRMEENLDGLIRAITAEHSNGKKKAS